MYYNPNVIINKLEKKLEVNYDDIKKNIKKLKIKLTEETIKSYLDKRFEEENPELKNLFDNPIDNSDKPHCYWTEQDIKNEANKLEIEQSSEKYVYTPYTLEYYKRLVTIYKTKCKNLIKLIDGLVDGSISKWTLSELDINLSKNGNVLMSDISRILTPLIYNYNKLKETVAEGNNLETYYVKKLSLDRLYKDGLSEDDLYPSDELQDEYSELSQLQEGFIPYTENQKVLVKKKEDDMIIAMCDIYKNLK